MLMLIYRSMSVTLDLEHGFLISLWGIDSSQNVFDCVKMSIKLQSKLIILKCICQNIFSKQSSNSCIY